MENKGHYNHLGAEDLTPKELRAIQIPDQYLNFIFVKAVQTSVIYTIQHHRNSEDKGGSWFLVNASYDSIFSISDERKKSMHKTIQTLADRLHGKITRKNELYKGKCVHADVEVVEPLTKDLVAMLTENIYSKMFNIETIGAYFVDVPQMDFSVPPNKLKLGTFIPHKLA